MLILVNLPQLWDIVIVLDKYKMSIGSILYTQPEVVAEQCQSILKGLFIEI